MSEKSAGPDRTNQEFTHAAEARQDKPEKRRGVDSEMIAKDAPVPYPSPDNAEEVNRKIFREELKSDDRRARGKDSRPAPSPVLPLARDRREEINLAANKGRSGTAFGLTAPDRDFERTRETEEETSQRAARIEAFKARLREERAAQRARDKDRDIER